MIVPISDNVSAFGVPRDTDAPNTGKIGRQYIYTPDTSNDLWELLESPGIVEIWISLDYMSVDNWLNYDAATKTFYGTPITPGFYSITIAFEEEPIAEWDIQIGQNTTIDNSAITRAYIGVEYSYTPSTNGNWSFLDDKNNIKIKNHGPNDAGHWLMYNPLTKTFTGTPTELGEWSVIVTYNGDPNDGEQWNQDVMWDWEGMEWLITVDEPEPEIPEVVEDTAAPGEATGPYSYTPGNSGIWENADFADIMIITEKAGIVNNWLTFENQSFVGNPPTPGTWTVTVSWSGYQRITWTITVTEPASETPEEPEGPVIVIPGLDDPIVINIEYEEAIIVIAGLLLFIGLWTRHPAILLIGGMALMAALYVNGVI